MASYEFFQPEARARVRSAIERVEAQTSAELVVAVRRCAGSYLAADLGWGAATALLALAFLVYAPPVFDAVWFPLDVTLAFVFGALFSWKTPTLRRLLCSPRRREENVRRAALEIFHDGRLSRTRGRNAILVVVGVFERRAVIVHDLGIDPADGGGALARAFEAVEASARGAFPKLEDFALSLEALGPPLAASSPRAEDDVNELPDEPEVG